MWTATEGQREQERWQQARVEHRLGRPRWQPRWVGLSNALASGRYRLAPIGARPLADDSLLWACFIAVVVIVIGSLGVTLGTEILRSGFEWDLAPLLAFWLGLPLALVFGFWRSLRGTGAFRVEANQRALTAGDTLQLEIIPTRADRVHTVTASLVNREYLQNMGRGIRWIPSLISQTPIDLVSQKRTSFAGSVRLPVDAQSTIEVALYRHAWELHVVLQTPEGRQIRETYPLWVVGREPEEQ